MTMGKLPDWQDRLAAYLEDCQGRRFAYGSHDCALFAAGAVEAMTGVDLAEGWRGRYRGPASARRALGGSPAEGLMATVDAALGPRRAPGEALAGDVLAVPLSATRIALGVCVGAGDMVALVRYPSGLVVRGSDPALAAWSV